MCVSDFKDLEHRILSPRGTFAKEDSGGPNAVLDESVTDINIEVMSRENNLFVNDESFRTEHTSSHRR